MIGKALLTNPKVLLMDEPSRGIDVGAKADVFLTMRRLAAEGLGIVFVTSDLEEVMALSDRIAVMSNGRMTALFDETEATRGQRRGRLGGRAWPGAGPRARRSYRMTAVPQSSLRPCRRAARCCCRS